MYGQPTGGFNYVPQGDVMPPPVAPKKGFLSTLKDSLGGHSPEQRQYYIQECVYEENQRWPTEQIRQIAKRYQASVGISHLSTEFDKKYLEFLRKGYFEPIPLAWAASSWNPLTQETPGSQYEDGAEERLYWILNHAYFHGRPRQPMMRPSEAAEMAMAYKRQHRAKTIDMSYASAGDVFRVNPMYLQKGYTKQVPAAPVHEGFAAMQHQANQGQIQVDTMILLDVSSSMGWDHRGFDQPRHVDVVHNILRRAIFHMEMRDRFPDPQGHRGVETVIFNSQGYQVGKIGPGNFEQKWGTIRETVYRGGGTQVMTGWNMVKNLHFELHGKNGNAWYDETYGWQATPQMPKLSLLVMLDGEASDMDEFELELLGENWAYVTIVLIGQENCPHHHRHANELERISRANDHIQSYDCHGRICERLVVHDVLQRVYAENAPKREEIMDPQFDTPPPAYTLEATSSYYTN